MKNTKQIKTQRTRRHARIRAKVIGTAERPRLSVFKSNTHTYAQLINDESGTTVAAANSRESKAKTLKERSREVGTLIAARGKEKGVSKVVFDRGGFAFIGVIREIADGAREAGLEF